MKYSFEAEETLRPTWARGISAPLVGVVLMAEKVIRDHPRRSRLKEFLRPTHVRFYADGVGEILNLTRKELEDVGRAIRSVRG